MKKRPLSLFLSSLLFLYFPFELFIRVWTKDFSPATTDILLSVVFPIALLFGLIRVTLVGWYNLIALISLWGVRDLYEYYMSRGASLGALIVHLGIYALSLSYFINPRIRHLYFDPKMRWWKTKPRYETHMALMTSHDKRWDYPILRNISEGGCFIETPTPAGMNETVAIAIPLPVPLEVSVIKAVGTVRWVSRSPSMHGMGIQFNDPDPQHVRAIQEFVRRHL